MSKGSLNRSLIAYVRQLIIYKSSIFEFAHKDFRSRYLGAKLGFLWLLLQQIAIVLIFYFVFSVGLRVQGPNGLEFMPWFITALVPWIFLSGGLTNATSSVTKKLFIVKKTSYPSQFFPLVSLISEVYVHLVFSIILFIFLVIYGIGIEWKAFLLLQYLAFGCILVLGIGLITSALNVYATDVSHALAIILNLFFWLTPIVWDSSIMPKDYHWMILWNPAHYLVNGYRECLLPNFGTLYSWKFHIVHFGFAFAVLLFGAYFFRKSKANFADVSR